MADNLAGNMNSSLRISQNAEIERLLAENKELKRQLTGGALGTASQIPYEELDIQDQVGGGGFAIVYRATWKGTPVAVKKWFDPNATDQMMQEFREEVMTLQSLRHPNVLQFLGACMKHPDLCMVTEHMPHSLHGVLYQMQGVDLDRKRIVALMQDAARAFIYLHSRKPMLVHRDIKPANFLVDRQWRVKVCDFGLASNNRAQAGAGTPAYMAPELFEAGKPYNEKVDVYAFGVMLNEMMAKAQPFAGMPAGDIRAAVLSGQRPEVPLSAPRVLSEIVAACWADEPADRPSFEKVLDMLKDAAGKL
uniref:non-specific serine/threonine protein kinase n=1 Tax=Chlamydomonas euryale TaxID=1486919 RepID=A0A7R9VLW3_9CHLO|mmetsp:Transcript_39231/g.116697  ORF Transcript_39231/g.116697 Transcript_39231/m.116697 type:complete len:306 (+) Transcript_39231:454-1371(+)